MLAIVRSSKRALAGASGWLVNAVLCLVVLGLAACSSKSNADGNADDDSGGGKGAILGMSGGAPGSGGARAGGAGMAGTPGAAGNDGCATGRTLCSFGCASLMTDAAHCGTCDHACPAGHSCQAGQCTACTGGMAACPGGCADLATSTANCGACGTVCAAGQTCTGGKCACPNGGTVCDGACVDLQADKAHCGACTSACGGDQTCTGGQCSCPNGLMACGETCTDLAANDNCGSCNVVCQGGQTCQNKACACAKGELACGGVCVDVTMNDANCGACGTVCPMGQVCLSGKCTASGDAGADGCTGGLARNVTLSQIDGLQSVAVTVMKAGAEVAASARNTDLVPGRETVFRIFVTPGSGWTARELSARVSVVNGATTDEYFTKKTVSAASTLDSDTSTIQVTVPPDKMTVDTKYHVELVECGTPPTADAVAPRFPTADDISLGVRKTGALNIVVVPLRSNAKTPATTDASLDPYRQLITAMYPINALNLSFRKNSSGALADPVDIDYPVDWNAALDTVRATRQADGSSVAADVYYFGLLMPRDTFAQFCSSGCTAGVGFVVTQSNASSSRAAVGIGFADNQTSITESAITMAHEVGHNHGRNHSPCAPRGSTISGVDSAYPYDGAAIGVWGYDSRSKKLINPGGTTSSMPTDIMGYCSNQWISDYTYDGLVNRVATLEMSKKVAVNQATLGRWRVLLVDALGPRWGHSITDPTPPSGTSELAEIFDDQGNVSEYATVYRTEVSDVGTYSIMVPEPHDGWYAVGVTGSSPHPFAAHVPPPVAARK
jgi:hypothetical protein